VKRRLKRFWLRYLYYCKEHWFIAASVVLTLLWLLWQVLTLLSWELLLEVAFGWL
jgi:hypothetical protein